MMGGASAGHDVLKGIGVNDEAVAPSANLDGQAQALPGPPPKLSLAELERMQKEQKKIAKKAHKAAKKVTFLMHSSAKHFQHCCNNAKK